MPFRSGLRTRIILVFIGFSILLSSMVVGGVILATHLNEKRSIRKRIELEAEYYMREHAVSDVAPVSNAYNFNIPSSPFVTVYYGDDLLPEWVEKEYGMATPGNYYLEHDKQDYHLTLKNLPDGERFYMLYNVTRFNTGRESLMSLRRTLIIVILPIIGFGLLLGFITAHKAISPVVKLTRMVRQSGDGRELPENLSSRFSDDEVGFLASTLEQSINGMKASVEREKSFARDASHELRTPVTTIKGAIELLEHSDAVQDEKLNRIIGRIKRSTMKMEHLITSFLWLSRHEVHSEEGIGIETVTVAREVIEDHEYLLQGKPVEVVIEEEDRQMLPVAPQIMSILLSNLLRNAFTYTQSGKVRVRILESCLRVEDTGGGIDRADLEKLRDGKGRYHADGFGFGISIVRRLCNNMGWHFLIDSRKGEGTKVVICFNQKERCTCSAKELDLIKINSI
ncbi:sensor histidine kinase [Limisalsivibrio acetivorans]|uniref:sensor histidine kinase n=1 Tax=Limisalsivibrio acetivorans TaxID=1304888 RepID=UPI0003B44E4C|nr:HAMP domain-containing sensor histidine kinase [Limisalsivibrio acetivorans]